MRVSDFDYELPERLIAQFPAEPRDTSRLLVVHRADGRLEDRVFSDIGDYLSEGDVLVLNNTRVIRARLLGRRRKTKARIETLLLRSIDEDRWDCLVRPGRRVRPGDIIDYEGGLVGHIESVTEAGGRIVRFEAPRPLEDLIDEIGQVPLPPYITRELDSPDQYQTVYAKHRGSVAAPTAGLHFTHSLLETLVNKGIRVVEITLHVGLGTFRPVSTENVEEHRMHSEVYEVPADAAAAVNEAREKGHSVVAVGTTSVRSLESAWDDRVGRVLPVQAETDIFIYPGYRFRVVDKLLTNFHLPKSTLLMLVSAFADCELILRAYRHAIEDNYRFFSFGDAMLIL
ncbi:MAG: tRNA preQ1(34) S-adenosylmethionine ribosyltransferase-isomerase QueA [Firmicutes bacterium]|nr:tRNA preQ1(34) S-adenosylmethionine ribosyltransferase-isomerase QueA [Bacillota bacterium]